MLSVALALGASLAYGVSNYMGPLQGRRHTTAGVLIVSQAAALAVSTVVLIGSAEPAPPAGAVLVGGLAGVANAAFLIFFYEAVRAGGRLSIIVPITSVGVALPVVYGLARGDDFRAVTGVGICCAVVGCMAAAWRKSEPDVTRIPLRAWLAWTVGATVASGVFLVALPTAAEEGRWWALVDARVVAVGVILAWLGARPGARWPPARALPALAIPGLLLLAGTVLYTLAADRGALAVVSVLSSLYPVVSVALAVVLLRERLDARQRGGVALTLLGIVLIASS